MLSRGGGSRQKSSVACSRNGRECQGERYIVLSTVGTKICVNSKGGGVIVLRHKRVPTLAALSSGCNRISEVRGQD